MHMVGEYQGLLNNISKYVSLSEEEQADLIGIIRVTKIKKRQYIDQPGFVSLYRNYIHQGAFRSFYVDDTGKQHTIQIAIEDHFCSDFYSYITQTPATLFVEALEDATILRMSYSEIESLCKKSHNLSEFFRMTTERAFAFARKRTLANLSQDAEQRYLAYLEKYPDIALRIPQKVIASYLGIAPGSLSRIRNHLSTSDE